MDNRSLCRVCGTSIEAFMSFGPMPLANGFSRPGEPLDAFAYELAPAMCQACGTFQLMEQPPAERMFHARYPFLTGTSTRMIEHFGAFAAAVRTRHGGTNGQVVEIGCNDGTLLAHLESAGFSACGVEPSMNVANIARGRGLHVVDGFFSPALAGAIRAERGEADVIVAANVICHIADIHGVLEAVTLLMANTGLFIFEEPYLGDMLATCAYDQIYDEHVFMWSATAVAALAARHGLVLTDIEHHDTHGGSLRYVLGRANQHTPSSAVAQQFEWEQRAGLSDPATYVRFARACEVSRDGLRDVLRRLARDGRRVAGYAATSKSTTVLNYAGIGPELIAYIADTTPMKHGTLTPGTQIPVRPAEEFHRDPPDYAVLFAWNHAAEIQAREQAFRERGGKWITFVPRVAIDE